MDIVYILRCDGLEARQFQRDKILRTLFSVELYFIVHKPWNAHRNADKNMIQ